MPDCASAPGADLMLIHALCSTYILSAGDSCLEQLPVYQDQANGFEGGLEGEMQAIVPAYRFTRHGRVTEWGTYAVSTPWNCRSGDLWEVAIATGWLTAIGDSVRIRDPCNHYASFRSAHGGAASVETFSVIHHDENEASLQLDESVDNVQVYWITRCR